MRLTPDQRCLIGRAVDKHNNKSLVARALGITRRTVLKWAKRREQLKDRKRKPKQTKVTPEVEYSILALRTSLKFGTARIQQHLRSAPPYIRDAIPGLVQGVKLSRPTLNKVLKKHTMNGYRNEPRSWKFFRAEKKDELWLIDFKGPFTIQGKKHWFLVVIDDYSRYLILFKYFDHCPKTLEAFNRLRPLILKRKPKNFLTDNGSQFKKEWEILCREHGIEPRFAHPRYPQDKGKVERTIRNANEEYIYHLRLHPGWLSKIDEYTLWYNRERFHRGINTVPAALYT